MSLCGTLYLVVLIYFALFFVKWDDILRCNHLFSLISHFGPFKHINISFFPLNTLIHSFIEHITPHNIFCTTLKLFYLCFFISMIGYTSHYCNQLSHGPNLVLEDVNITFFLSHSKHWFNGGLEHYFEILQLTITHSICKFYSLIKCPALVCICTKMYSWTNSFSYGH